MTARRVALIVEMSGIYGRRSWRESPAICDLTSRGRCFLEQRELRAPPPPWLLKRPWDGIICRSTTPPLARAFRRRKLPVVDLNDLFGGWVTQNLVRHVRHRTARGRALLGAGFSLVRLLRFSGRNLVARTMRRLPRNRRQNRRRLRRLRIALARPLRARMGQGTRDNRPMDPRAAQAAWD